MILELQKLLFENKPSRMELLNYIPKSKNRYKIFVYRNHSFELIENTIGAYLDYADIRVEFSYSGYDDSLSFGEFDETTDMILIWIDTTRYKDIYVESFLQQRLDVLKKIYKKPILFIPYGQDIEYKDKAVVTYSLENIKILLNNKYIDDRMKEYTGTSLSNKAMLMLSKELGLKYIPAILKTSLKAIVVDLDNTLYNGVLGEDGIYGINLTEGHIKLQKQLQELSNSGFLLCIASKNNISDVKSLLEDRNDFILKEKDFAKICASWNSKADSIEEISKFLNINPDSMIFIDDNIGELMSVSMIYPNMKLIQAYEDANLTNEVLSYYPGLLKLNTGKEDNLRKMDIKANEQRKSLQKQLSPEEYIRSLELKLTFNYNNKDEATRIFQLANKTNQFIFNYKRYTQAEIDAMMESKDCVIIAISLSDKLSDSGLVGGCVGKNRSNFVEIEEFFISCRALGRGIDDVIVLEAFNGAIKYFGHHHIKVNFQKGERNEPAENFVKKYLNEFLEKEAYFEYIAPQNLIQIERKGN